VSSQVT